MHRLFTALFFTLAGGCWAPERQAPGPRISPAEMEASTEQSSGGIRLIPNPNRRQAVDKSENPENDEERKPPYTAWTLNDNTPIIGPNGSEIMAVERQGVRLDVLSVSGQYAQILCSGCDKPKKNHAGWVLLTSIASAWDLPPGTALNAMATLRQKWIKGQDIPEEFENKRDLCMLVDVGFTVEDGVANWSIDGGMLKMQKASGEWELVNSREPNNRAESIWRCDIQYPN